MKILIIKLGALGDIVMSTALLKAIERHHAGDELWLLTAPPFGQVFERRERLKVRALPRKGWSNMARAIWWVRRHRFDCIYDLQSNDRTSVLCALSGAAVRVGNHTRFPYTHHPPEPWRGQSHIMERMCEVLRSAGIRARDCSPELPIFPEEKHAVKLWMEQQHLTPGRFILMHAGASPQWPSKRWPHYQELARALERHGQRAVWIGAAADGALNAELAAQVGVDATSIGVSLAASLARLAELGRHARCAITNDSAPMHVLACSGIPVYGFFGPTNWRRNHAAGQGERVLSSDQPCRACTSANKRTAEGHSCLADIRVEHVLARLARDGVI